MSLMNKFEGRRGSALLIVLGMLAFMVVSAVGFSIFMRQSRLPSSFLRRNVASRYLVKAALANAIEEIDCGFMSEYEIGIDDDEENGSARGYVCGIHDDPYPGCVSAQVKSSMQSGKREINGRALDYCENGNLWFHRVFCPFGPLFYPTGTGAQTDDNPLTVPTMTLEALAYLPPAIADDVRRASRMSRTAMWKSLPYESGRYAYTAVNVSDLFDINRLRAGLPRNSGPDKISLAPLTSNDPQDPSKVNSGDADKLDDAIDLTGGNGGNGANNPATAPFVSLADFALSAAGTDYSPFSKYVGRTAGQLLSASDAKAANSMFVTDSWFPTTNGVGQAKAYDLAGGHQPFKAGTFGPSRFSSPPKTRPRGSAGVPKTTRFVAATAWTR